MIKDMNSNLRLLLHVDNATIVRTKCSAAVIIPIQVWRWKVSLAVSIFRLMQ